MISTVTTSSIMIVLSASNSDQSSTPSADDANSTLALVLPLEPTRTARYRPILARHVQISIIGGAASSVEISRSRAGNVNKLAHAYSLQVNLMGVAQPTCGTYAESDDGEELYASSILVFSLTPGSCCWLLSWSPGRHILNVAASPGARRCLH